jgi:hypothetical protein
MITASLQVGLSIIAGLSFSLIGATFCRIGTIICTSELRNRPMICVSRIFHFQGLEPVFYSSINAVVIKITA